MIPRRRPAEFRCRICSPAPAWTSSPRLPERLTSSGYADFGAIFDGFYVSDTENPDGTGADVPEIVFHDGFFAAAEVGINLGIAKAVLGAGGGPFMTVGFDLHDNDGDGKVRFGEIADNLKLGLVHVFDVSGAFTAELFAYVTIKLSLGFFSITIIDQQMTLATITLVDFEIPRPEDGAALSPLATVESATGVPEASGNILRMETGGGDDKFEIVRGSGDSIVIRSQGRVETHSIAREGIIGILFDGGGGRDREMTGSLPAKAITSLTPARATIWCGPEARPT